MGSPLSPMVTNLYMEYFEKKAIDSLPLKPKYWRRYVDDTNFILHHGRDDLENILRNLHNYPNHIISQMEIHKNDYLPFLDVMITRNEDDSLVQSIY